MAYKDSETLQSGSPYALGEYTFNCVFDDSPTLGQFARASMSKDGQTAYKTVSIPNASQIDGWTVEANETEASVYAFVRIWTGNEKTSDLDTNPVTQPIHYSNKVVATYDFTSGGTLYRVITEYTSAGAMTAGCNAGAWGYYVVFAGTEIETITEKDTTIKVSTGEVIQERTITHSNNLSYTHNNRTVYYTGVSASVLGPVQLEPNVGVNFSSGNSREVAWTIVYGNNSGDEYEQKEILVGRFAIDIEDAGGVGPGSDWTDPGDYDPDWEEGDPTHTLYVTVTGALSGRHNDPIEDPSYSYIPADKDTVKDYGCGGDGGHGGGGGAGASTVVIHKFATNQANSKEVTALARRHGYGSGGGKGGKGGDGCILVYY